MAPDDLPVGNFLVRSFWEFFSSVVLEFLSFRWVISKFYSSAVSVFFSSVVLEFLSFSFGNLEFFSFGNFECLVSSNSFHSVKSKFFSSVVSKFFSSVISVISSFGKFEFSGKRASRFFC